MAWLAIGFVIAVLILIILASLEEWEYLVKVGGVSVGVLGLGYVWVSKGSGAFGLLVYGLLVLGPILAGLLGKVPLRWVLLWEVVMFSPLLFLFWAARRRVRRV